SSGRSRWTALRERRRGPRGAPRGAPCSGERQGTRGGTTPALVEKGRAWAGNHESPVRLPEIVRALSVTLSVPAWPWTFTSVTVTGFARPNASVSFMSPRLRSQSAIVAALPHRPAHPVGR